ncbi:MAG: hypothetical protein K2N03_04905, partial [Muribaculaceae bacterium]|nr:hypothetical protein [Muribaculaceae bacterium]
MKKRILTYLLLAICSILPMTAKGGKVPFEVSDTIKARDVFVDLPANVLNLLKKSTRISMLHYFDADSIWSVSYTHIRAHETSQDRVCRL